MNNIIYGYAKLGSMTFTMPIDQFISHADDDKWIHEWINTDHGLMINGVKVRSISQMKGIMLLVS